MEDTSAAPASSSPRRPSHVQSVERVFSLLEAMADVGGVAGVSDLADVSGLPTPTIHRLLRTLVSLGYARQEPSREYALGPRLVGLGDAAGKLVEQWANPYMRRLADLLGESANLALMEGTEIVYVAQAPGRHSMRMFTEVGHRASLHCTAVGKAILSTYPMMRAREIVSRITFREYTPQTITSPERFLDEVEIVRTQGFALDRGEREVGVVCVAVALPGSPARGAVSISGPVTRMTTDTIRSALPMLKATATDLGAKFDAGTA